MYTTQTIPGVLCRKFFFSDEIQETVTQLADDITSTLTNILDLLYIGPTNPFLNCNNKFIQFTLSIKPQIIQAVNDFEDSMQNSADNETGNYLINIAQFSNLIDSYDDVDDCCIYYTVVNSSPDSVRQDYIECARCVDKKVEFAASYLQRALVKYLGDCSADNVRYFKILLFYK